MMFDAPSRPAPGDYTAIRYETPEGIAKVTIDRPEVRNAFRPLTTRELIAAFEDARDDPSIGVVVLTGAGTEAFSSGGDQRIRGDDGYVDERGIGRLNVLDLQIQIRRFPQAGERDGRGVRDRRWARAAPVLRPHDRGGQRPVRPDRAAGRVVRRG